MDDVVISLGLNGGNSVPCFLVNVADRTEAESTGDVADNVDLAKCLYSKLNNFLCCLMVADITEERRCLTALSNYLVSSGLCVSGDFGVTLRNLLAVFLRHGSDFFRGELLCL